MPVCQNCKKREATFNFIETVGGETVELHLCEFCYKFKYGEFESIASNAFINGLFGEVKPADSKTCKVCGTSFADYERTGLLGCPSCYDVFNEELLPTIMRIHGKITHVGREGGDHSSEHDLRRKLAELQQRLEDAIHRGDFREAGRLNEQMTSIKRRINGGGNG